jgi:hypothetical protein
VTTCMNAQKPSLSIVKNTAKISSREPPDVGRHVQTSEGIGGADSARKEGERGAGYVHRAVACLSCNSEEGIWWTLREALR